MGATTSYNHREFHSEDGQLLDRIKLLESKLLEAEKRYISAEKKYGLIIDNVKEVIFQTDAAGRWTFLNPAWTVITGFGVAESIGTHFSNYVHPDDREHNQALFTPLIGREKEYCQTIRCLTKNGSIRWIEANSHLTLDETGETLGITGTLNDITERKQAEEELRRTQERLTLVVEAARAGIWDWDILNGTFFLDNRWKAMLGYSESEITDTLEAWRSFIHPDDAARVEQARQDYLDGNTAKYQVEFRLRHKNGDYRWVYSAGKLAYDQANRPVRWAGFCIDITDLHRSKELNLEGEKKLRDFAQAVPDISYIIDEDGRFLESFGNARILSRPNEELRGLNIREVLSPKEADFVLQKIRQTIESGLPRHGVREMALGGVKRFLEGRIAPMRYLADGRRTAALVITDVTDRVITERMLQLSYQLQRRSDFINDIVNGHTVVDKKAVAFAESLGLDFSRPLCCCLMTSDRFAATASNDSCKTDDQRSFKNAIITILSGEADCMVWDGRDNIGILYQGKESGTLLAGHLWNKIRQVYPQLEVIVGVGDSDPGPDSVYKSFRHAWSAVTAARCQGGRAGGIYHYRNLGLFQLLTAFGSKEPANHFVEEIIGKLLDYDREKGTDYLATLEEILKTSNLREAAEKLFIHHKTAVYRKQRIEKILGTSVDNFETRLALATAIKLYRLSEVI